MGLNFEFFTLDLLIEGRHRPSGGKPVRWTWGRSLKSICEGDPGTNRPTGRLSCGRRLPPSSRGKGRPRGSICDNIDGPQFSMDMGSIAQSNRQGLPARAASSPLCASVSLVNRPAAQRPNSRWTWGPSVRFTKPRRTTPPPRPPPPPPAASAPRQADRQLPPDLGVHRLRHMGREVAAQDLRTFRIALSTMSVRPCSAHMFGLVRSPIAG